jgi:hypothetical protein
MRTHIRLALLSAAALGAALLPSSALAQPGPGGLSPTGYAVAGDSATFPLHPGRTETGAPFWYIVVEASDSRAADRFGVRVAQKLQNAAGSAAVQDGELDRGVLVTPGSVDFSPDQQVAGSPGTGFPPVLAEPGSVGEGGYSPLVQLPDGSVINAPVVANATGAHDKVQVLDLAAGRVSLRLTHGFARGGAVRYLSTDASDPGVAALEASTWAAPLEQAPGLGDDSTASSRATLAAFVNGPLAPASARQGLNSALLGGGDPLNVLAWLPNQGRYSPLWDVHLAAWAPGQTAERVMEVADVEELAEAGRVTGPDGGPWTANGIVVNCPILALG